MASSHTLFSLPSLTFALALGSLAAGCSKSTPEKSATTTADSITVTTSSLASSAPNVAVGDAGSHGIVKLPEPPPGATVAAMPNEPMGERFALEAKGRPTGTVKAEDALSAINNAGFEVTEPKQHLASVFGARYCVGAKIADEKKVPQMDASVCEYADDAAVKIGKERSLEGFKIIKNRTITMNKLTTLTIREYAPSDANDALVAKVQAVFLKL